MLKNEDLEKIEYYLSLLQVKLERKLDDDRIPPLNKGLKRIYDEQVEELKELQKKLFIERIGG